MTFSFRFYLRVMFGVTLFSFMAWVLTLIYIDPSKSGVLGFSLFYLTLFFTLIGIFTLFGFKLRQKLVNNEIVYALITLSFRQAILVSIFFISALIMKSSDLLTWWDGLLLFISIFLLEAFFLTD